MKRCSKCGVEKALADFYPRGTAAPGRWRSSCKVCTTAQATTPTALAKYKSKKYHLRPSNKARAREKATGFTPGLFSRVLEMQKGLCAICSKKLLGPGVTQAQSGSKACADHDHITRTPRGVLCGRCNSALGLFDDSPTRLISAAYYLVNPPVKA